MLQGVGARRGVTVAVILLALIGLGIWVAVRGSDDSPTPEAAARSGATTGQDGGSGQAGKEKSSRGDEKNPDERSELPALPADSGTSGAGEQPQAQPGEKGFELPGVKPAAKPPAYLFLKAPAAESATGRIVAAYPTKYLPFPKGTTVLSTEVTSDGDRVRAVAEGKVKGSPDKVFGYYQQALGELGLDVSTSPAVGGSEAKVYSNPRTSVTLTVRKDGSSVVFSLFTVTTAKAA